MHRLRERDGWTLIEMLTILAIVGVMSTMAIASLRGYSRREDTRRAARAVAGILESARSEALTSGRMTWVVFKQPANGVAPFAAGQFAALIRDTDNDLQPTAADTVTPIMLPSGAREHTHLWEAGTSPYGSVALPGEDYSNDVPDGTLANTVGGTTLNVDVLLQAPTIGFSSQGFPVRAANPLQPGTGAGTIYLTDNESSVVAVTVLPIGDIHTLAYDNGSDTWK
jgi:type II secretory pathway pseudopilin PulG